MIDISNRAPGTPAWLDRLAPANHLVSEMNKMKDLQKRVDDLQVKE
jgi:hypothetical protein